MIDPYVLLTPLLLLPVVWLLRFIGCTSFGDAAADIKPPTVVITAPPANSHVFGGPMTVTAIATADTGQNIKDVQFQIDAADFGSKMAPSPPANSFVPSVTVDTSKLTEGAHSLTAVATDATGQAATSAKVDIQVEIPKPLITAFVPGPAPRRNDYTGFLGMSFTVGPKPLLVHALGRLHLSGNVQSHAVKIVIGASQADLTGAIVTVPPAGVADNQFSYSPLPAPVTLAAGGFYFLVSYEENGKDQFLPNDTQVTAGNVVAVNGPEYDQPFGTDPGKPNQSYGLVNLKYTVAS